MTRVVVTNWTNLLNCEQLRSRYERQKWREENKGYNPEEDTICVKVCDTDPFNPLPSHLKSDR